MTRAALLLSASLAALPAAAEPVDLTIHYLTREYERPLPLSLIENPVPDEGLTGARLAMQESQFTGKLMKQTYTLAEHVLPLDAPFPEAAVAIVAEGPRFIVADLEAADLLALADLPETQDDVILNTRAEDDALRLTDCRKNVWHIMPNTAMKTDALAQYLVWKRWDDWLVVAGEDPADAAYADAVERSAKKFGAHVVERRAYAFEAGARRVESGHQQIQTQMPQLTQGSPEHDVVVVADVSEKFGDYLVYRNFEARPVVGTQGLVAADWHRTFEQFGSMSLRSAFEKLAGRPVTESDYVNWLAIKTIAEVALRKQTGDPAAITAEFLSPDFKSPGFKGIGLNFRTWDQQMRQPILIAWERQMVSMSPQDGFLHERNILDSLGFDLADSTCRLNPGD